MHGQDFFHFYPYVLQVEISFPFFNCLEKNAHVGRIGREETKAIANVSKVTKLCSSSGIDFLMIIYLSISIIRDSIS